MKEISWSKFRSMNLQELKAGPCLVVTGDGDAALWVIVGAQQAMQHRIRGVASQIDAGRGIGRAEAVVA